MFVTNKVCGKVNDGLVLVSLRRYLGPGRGCPYHLLGPVNGLELGESPLE